MDSKLVNTQLQRNTGRYYEGEPPIPRPHRKPATFLLVNLFSNAGLRWGCTFNLTFWGFYVILRLSRGQIDHQCRGTWSLLSPMGRWKFPEGKFHMRAIKSSLNLQFLTFLNETNGNIIPRNFPFSMCMANFHWWQCHPAVDKRSQKYHFFNA